MFLGDFCNPFELRQEPAEDNHRLGVVEVGQDVSQRESFATIDHDCCRCSR